MIQRCSTYDEFFNAVTNGSVAYDRQQKYKSENVTQLVEKEDTKAMVKEVNKMMVTPSKFVPPSNMSIFKLLKDCKSKYRYVSDVLTKENFFRLRKAEIMVERA